MATIHKLTKDGSTIFPATITDAVVHQDTGKTLTSMIKNYNVSELFPSEGVDGGNKYNLALAISVLGTHLTAAEKTGGISLTFISSGTGYPEEEYFLNKNIWSTNVADWGQRFEVGDVVADPSGSWTPSTAEQYIDQKVGVLNADLTQEVIARQTGDSNLQTQLNSEAALRSALSAEVDTLEEEVAYIGENDGSSLIADFDPQTDTVWKKPQVLSSAEKTQVQTNINVYGKDQTYTKTEVNGLVDTPHQNYVTVATYASLPASGSTDTIYRVSNYNGSTSQVDASVYSEYAWNGSAYIFLCVKSQIGEVFDITVYNNNTTYADLAAALGNGGENVPESLRKGGMSVKYVQSYDNKYHQSRLMAQSFTTDVTQWQGVTSEIKLGSRDLIDSNGVFPLKAKVEGLWNVLQEYSGRIVTNGTYYEDSTGTQKYKVIPLTQNDIIIITLVSGSFAFLPKEIPAENGEYIGFASEEGMDALITTPDEYTFTVPADAKYLYIRTIQNGSATIISKLFINGYDCLTSLSDKIENKQPLLISGENIKTLNGQSILGNGDINLETGDNTNPYIIDKGEYYPVTISSYSGDVVEDSNICYTGIKAVRLSAEGSGSSVSATLSFEEIDKPDTLSIWMYSTYPMMNDVSYYTVELYDNNTKFLTLNYSGQKLTQSYIKGWTLLKLIEDDLTDEKISVNKVSKVKIQFVTKYNAAARIAVWIGGIVANQRTMPILVFDKDMGIDDYTYSTGEFAKMVTYNIPFSIHYNSHDPNTCPFQTTPYSAAENLVLDANKEGLFELSPYTRGLDSIYNYNDADAYLKADLAYCKDHTYMEVVTVGCRGDNCSSQLFETVLKDNDISIIRGSGLTFVSEFNRTNNRIKFYANSYTTGDGASEIQAKIALAKSFIDKLIRYGCAGVYFTHGVLPLSDVGNVSDPTLYTLKEVWDEVVDYALAKRAQGLLYFRKLSDLREIITE